MPTANVRIIGHWEDSDTTPAAGTVYFQRHDTILDFGNAVVFGQVERTRLDADGSIDTEVLARTQADAELLAMIESGGAGGGGGGTIPDDSLGILDPDTVVASVIAGLVGFGMDQETAEAVGESVSQAAASALDGRQPGTVALATNNIASLLQVSFAGLGLQFMVVDNANTRIDATNLQANQTIADLQALRDTVNNLQDALAALAERLVALEP